MFLLDFFRNMPSYSINITPTTAVAVFLSALAARSAWNQTPAWVKEYLGNAKKPKVKDANDNLATPAAIASKLKAFLDLTYQQSSDLLPADMPYYKLYCCLMSFVHNRTEIMRAFPAFRDEFYRKEGLKLHISEIEVLEEYMEYAEWAYDTSMMSLQDKIRARNLDLIRLDAATEPGRVAHFIVTDKATKRVIISIKGTSTFSDILTDLVGVTVEHELNGQKVRWHEGMYTAAKMLLDDTVHLIEEFFLPAGYSVVVTGHSLGAGAACLLGVLLRNAIPVFQKDKKRLRVYAFATPACLGLDACRGCMDFVTSVVNNTDCVPRVSVSSMRVLHRFFMHVSELLQKKGLDPTDWEKTQKFLADIMVVDDDLLMTPTQYETTAERVLTEEEPFLQKDFAIFVPGKVVVMWECDAQDEHTVDARSDDGAMRVVRCLDITTTMVGDHGTANYRKNLHTLAVETRDKRKFSG